MASRYWVEYRAGHAAGTVKVGFDLKTERNAFVWGLTEARQPDDPTEILQLWEEPQMEELA